MTISPILCEWSYSSIKTFRFFYIHSLLSSVVQFSFITSLKLLFFYFYKELPTNIEQHLFRILYSVKFGGVTFTFPCSREAYPAFLFALFD